MATKAADILAFRKISVLLQTAADYLDMGEVNKAAKCMVEVEDVLASVGLALIEQ